MSQDSLALSSEGLTNPEEVSPFTMSELAERVNCALATVTGKSSGTEALADQIAKNFHKIHEEEDEIILWNNKERAARERLKLAHTKLLVDLAGSRQQLDINEQIAEMSDRDRHSVLMRAAITEFNASPEFRQNMIKAIMHAEPELFRDTIQSVVKEMAAVTHQGAN